MKNKKPSFKKLLRQARLQPQPLPGQGFSKIGMMLFSLPFLAAGLGIIGLSIGAFEGAGIAKELEAFFNQQLWSNPDFWMQKPKKASIRRYALVCVGMIFFLGGLMALFQGLFLRSNKKVKYRGSHSSSPWLTEYPWHQSEAILRKHSSGFISGLMASAIILMFVIIGYEVYLQSGTKIFLIGSLIFAVLIIFAVMSSAIKRSKQKAHYGNIELHYSSFPINLGSEIDCHIRFKQSVQLKDARVVIQCAQEYVQQTSDSNNYVTKSLYTKEIIMPQSELRQSASIHFKLEIPDDINLRTEIKTKLSKFWEVSVYGTSTKNIGFSEKYLIPVY